MFQLSNIQEIRKVVSKVPDAQVMSDLMQPSLGQHRQLRGISTITGFCWGGRIVWLYAAHNPKVKAGVAVRTIGVSHTLNPKHPVDIAAELEVPILGLYGGNDDGIPVATVEQMRKALKAGAYLSIVSLPRHAARFFCRLPPLLQEKQAEDGWNAYRLGSSSMGLVMKISKRNSPSCRLTFVSSACSW